MKGTITLFSEELPTTILKALKSLEQSGYQLVNKFFGPHTNIKQLTVMSDVVLFVVTENNYQCYLESIKHFSSNNQNIPITIITNVSSEELAVMSLKNGIRDYFTTPFEQNDFIRSIKTLLNLATRKDYGGYQEYVCDCKRLEENIIGSSPVMSDIKSSLKNIGLSDSSVLISGETGTGKELIASLIHQLSGRSTGSLICVNCAAVPESLVESEFFGFERGAFTGAEKNRLGKFELADNGSIFLDEISDMSRMAQAKILRVLENKKVFRIGGSKEIPLDFRILAATNKEPEILVSDGEFREDLFYRLNVARVHLPPLRERIDDIPDLLDYARKKYNGRFKKCVKGISDEVLELFLRYDWPGNIRELMNTLEAAYINLPDVDEIRSKNLPELFLNQQNLMRKCPIQERKNIVATLMKTNWNKSSAAQKLNWSRMTLYRKMEQYSILETRS